jgi:hypothetical protein
MNATSQQQKWAHNLQNKYAGFAQQSFNFQGIAMVMA